MPRPPPGRDDKNCPAGIQDPAAGEQDGQRARAMEGRPGLAARRPLPAARLRRVIDKVVP